MSLTLPTFASGAVVNATVMLDLVNSVQTYVNEGIVAADRAAGWMVSNHVYRPDFYGGVNPHTTATSGESYMRERSNDPALQSVWSYYIGDAVTTEGLYPIPGMSATIEIPEDINLVLGGSHRVRVFASLYCYEYGGEDGNLDEENNIAFYVNLLVNGVNQQERTPIHKGSSTGPGLQSVLIYPRHQVAIMKHLSLGRGVHNISIAIDPRETVTANQTKLCFVVQGNLLVRYSCR